MCNLSITKKDFDSFLKPGRMVSAAKYILFLLWALLAFVSCEKEELSPEQAISGKYAPVDGTDIAGSYIEFEGGTMTFYSSENTYTFADNAFWHCSSSDFKKGNSYTYYLKDDKLYRSDGTCYGKFVKSGKNLTLGGASYSSLESFQSGYYSSIEVENTITVPYQAGSQSVEVTIKNPIASGILSAATSVNWISDISVSKSYDKLTFSTSVSISDRTGKITLRYTNAQDVILTVNQRTSTYIILPSTREITDYTSKDASFEYSIRNPIESSFLSFKCDASWVTDINKTESSIKFKVGDNAASSPRTATFTLSYAGASDAIYTLVQSSTTTAIVLSESSKTLDYKGGAQSVGYTVENPHEGTTLTAYTSQDWITDLKVSSDKITFNVSENSSVSSRSGKITLKYGSLAAKEISVAQSEMPLQSLSLDKTSLNLKVDETATLKATVVPADAPLTWSSSDKVIATVDRNGKVSAVCPGSATITVTSGDKTASCAVTVTRATPIFSISPASLSIYEGYSGTITITSNSDCTFTASSSNTSVATVSVSEKVVTVSGKSLGNTTITVNCPQTAKYSAVSSLTCRVLVVEPKDYPVDLGLSVKWAFSNVGAYKPEEYGTYFAWGDVKGQTWNGSSWSGEGFFTVIPYEIDVNNNLKPSYDAAHVNWGGTWRMPTKAECQELIDNCTSTWTSDYNGTGVAGCIFTSKKSGYTDKFIFLPAAGYGYRDSLFLRGSFGFYWSATFYGGYYAYELIFDSSGVNTCDDDRFYGRSVRPVSE